MHFLVGTSDLYLPFPVGGFMFNMEKKRTSVKGLLSEQLQSIKQGETA